MTPEIRLNGVRYCWPDRPVVVVCNDGEAHDGRALLRVCDQGPVIGQRERTGLFLPFHRVAGASGSQGTGLGLALVRQIARRHGGDVAYEAERGNCFTVSLPGLGVKLPGYVASAGRSRPTK